MSTHWKRLGLALVLSCFAGASCDASAEKPIWAEAASVLDFSCLLNPKGIASPDHQSSVSVLCHKKSDGAQTYSVQLKLITGQTYESPLGEGAHELLWAPNSLTFFVDGGASGYAGFFVSVYRLTSDGVQRENITGKAQKNMVATFPPCRAANRDEAACTRATKDPEYNMSGVGWSKNSTSVFVFAEVPCSSSYGGIMCQVQGYALDAASGRIRERFTASQVKKRWGDLMAWPMQVPDLPIYTHPKQKLDPSVLNRPPISHDKPDNSGFHWAS